ncbi:endonuclease/exonuclease/phosphatase family protein [Plastorhodobacter daqingensis]|uniref:Endonuclease/exonuclease/phosphatase family protein n=1 Tax=Plastorhodobacter daqingensis TaxID=1387281 RepID=A0ABW2UF49_9RHOB
MRSVFVTGLMLWLLVGPALADPLRVATYNAALTRRGPGLLLQDILKGEDQVQAAVAMIVAARPDILLLNKFDYDFGGAALDAFAESLGAAGLEYPHRFAARPNTGWATGLDLDGDGRLGTADDAQGYGRFAGAGGMAILSRHPLGEVRDFSGFLWRDLPGALLPQVDGAPFPSAAVFEEQRLASVAAWEVAVLAPTGRLGLLAFHAGPPVFGGPHDRNLRRNHDEVSFWRALLDGELPLAPPEPPFVLLGGANLDPERGDGMGQAIRALLAHPQLHDPLPGSDSVRWERLGPMRVDYVLPSWPAEGAGLLWPEDALGPEREALASAHALVWVDLRLPAP